MDERLVRKLQNLQKEIEEAKAQHQRAAGELEGLSKQLKEEYKVSGLKEAEALLEKMETELEEKEAQFQTEVEELERKMQEFREKIR